MLLDLQLVRYGTATSELQNLLYTSTVGNVRKPNLQAFLNCYHETYSDIMQAAGRCAPFSTEQLLKDFKDKIILGGVFGVMLLPVVMIQGDGTTVDSSKDSGESMEEKMAMARERALATLDTNPLLRPRFLSIIDEMMEGGIIP